MWIPGMTLESVEQAAIEDAFRYFLGNKTQTAQALGIAIRTLDSKLEKYEYDRIEHKRRAAEEQSKREEWLAKSRGLTEGQSVYSAHQVPTDRVRVEPIVEIMPKSAMSMPERSEVQEMSQKPSARVRNNRTGRDL